MKIEIKNWMTGSVLFEGDFSCLADAVKAAVKSSADLSYADLSYAYLRSADLSYADLRSANLSYADLSYADLSYADLRSADLSSANLRYANLSSANLRSANLSSADLSYANLSSANLSYAIYRYAQIAFTGHGECGRMLTAIQLKEGAEVDFFCGCFNGNEKELRKYIEKGAPHLRKTRTLAMETVLTLLAAENDKPE